MICPSCKTNNSSSATVCWSCGKPIPAPASAQAKPLQPATNPTRNRAPGDPVNVANDFWIGFWTGGLGLICATIIDKRKGFWAAFWGVMTCVSLASTFVLTYFGIAITLDRGSVPGLLILLMFAFLGLTVWFYNLGHRK